LANCFSEGSAKVEVFFLLCKSSAINSAQKTHPQEYHPDYQRYF